MPGTELGAGLTARRRRAADTYCVVHASDSVTHSELVDRMR